MALSAHCGAILRPSSQDIPRVVLEKSQSTQKNFVSLLRTVSCSNASIDKRIFASTPQKEQVGIAYFVSDRLGVSRETIPIYKANKKNPKVIH